MDNATEETKTAPNIQRMSSMAAFDRAAPKISAEEVAGMADALLKVIDPQQLIQEAAKILLGAGLSAKLILERAERIRANLFLPKKVASAVASASGHITAESVKLMEWFTPWFGSLCAHLEHSFELLQKKQVVVVGIQPPDDPNRFHATREEWPAMQSNMKEAIEQYALVHGATKDNVSFKRIPLSELEGFLSDRDKLNAEQVIIASACSDHFEAVKACAKKHQNVVIGYGRVDDASALQHRIEHFERQKVKAVQGDAEAQFVLGVIYTFGKGGALQFGIQPNDKEAVRWYRAAAEQGHSIAQFNLGVTYANGRGVPQDDKEAVRWYRAAAEQGYAAAKYNLGVMYRDGQDDKEAVRWFRAAAEQGDADAQCNLGAMYGNGQGVPQDDKEAVRCYRAAAEQGDADAQSNLGVMYRKGQGVPQDDKEAVRWYRAAAEQGHSIAQFHLGGRYAKGQGVPQDDKEAVRWCRAAAEQGHADAQCNLGGMYRNGQGVPQDDKQAEHWFRAAAEQGHANAQYNLGLMYRNGRGVSKDDEKAARWFRAAAEQDHADAQYCLGHMHETGLGVPQDNEQAVLWYLAAAEKGNAAARSALGRLVS